jgi:hypothetical protein
MTAPGLPTPADTPSHDGTNPKEAPVTTESNGRAGPARNLPAAPEPGPPPRPRQQSPGTHPPSPDAPGQPGLADQDRRKRWERRIRRWRADADHRMQRRVRHPDGGERTVTQTQADEDEQRQQITGEMARGSRKHRRLPRWQHQIPKIVLFFDFALLLYFFAGITNVDWQSPVSMVLAFAIALAAMVTVLAYGFLAFTGHRMRSYKNHAGTVHVDELDGFTKAAFGTAMTVIAVLAALMYLRIRSEVIGALGPGTGVSALVIPLAVAVVSAVANYLVVLIHALDGSDEVARLDKLAAATRRPARRAQRLRRRATQAQW